MIIVQKITKRSVKLLSALAKVLGPIFFLSKEPGVFIECSPRKKKRIRSLVPLPLSSCERLDDYRLCNYSDEKELYSYVDDYLPESSLLKIGNYFAGVDDLPKKIRIAFATSLGYHQLGTAMLYANQVDDAQSVLFVHTSVASFFRKGNGVKGADRFCHIYWPVDDLLGFADMLYRKVRKKVDGLLRSQEDFQKPIKDMFAEKKTAVIFHSSVQYGPLNIKNHYFSTCRDSEMYPDRILSFVLGRNELYDDFDASCVYSLVDLVRAKNQKNLFDSISLIRSLLKQINTFPGLVGALFVLYFYNSYRAWGLTFDLYPSLKNVIYDYDVLFPKSLSLALESRGIRTIALQERPCFSFAFNYGVIVDTYLLAGGLFTKKAQNNSSYSIKSPINSGQYRVVYFSDSTNVDLKEIGLSSFGDKDVSGFCSYIVCLGWFVDQENPDASPVTSREALLSFLSAIKSLALSNSDSAIILRMKLLFGCDREQINDTFDGVRNVFLCDDYSSPGISYLLCSIADVVVSVPTSLADECLAVGKKVVYLDFTHNLSGIFTDAYPTNFHFCAAKNACHLRSLVSRCIDGDDDLCQMYDLLRSEIKGDYELACVEDVSKALELCLL